MYSLEWAVELFIIVLAVVNVITPTVSLQYLKYIKYLKRFSWDWSKDRDNGETVERYKSTVFGKK